MQTDKARLEIKHLNSSYEEVEFNRLIWEPPQTLDENIAAAYPGFEPEVLSILQELHRSGSVSPEIIELLKKQHAQRMVELLAEEGRKPEVEKHPWQNFEFASSINDFTDRDLPPLHE